MSRGYHHGELRAALVRAARELIAERGAAEFSVAEVARRCGVSSAAPYRHFTDRNALLAAVAAGIAAGVGAELGRAARLTVPLALLIVIVNPLVYREGETLLIRGGEFLGYRIEITLEATLA